MYRDSVESLVYVRPTILTGPVDRTLTAMAWTGVGIADIYHKPKDTIYMIFSLTSMF